MNLFFIDTSYLIALALKTDALHGTAMAWHRTAAGTFVTTEFVLLEVANGLCRGRDRLVAQAIVRSVRKDASIVVIPSESQLLERGYGLFCERPDKEWSLTDCISFEIMRERAIDAALTHDHHFEQAGFKALLRGDSPGS